LARTPLGRVNGRCSQQSECNKAASLLSKLPRRAIDRCGWEVR
jgi:hypothetical protein